MPVAVSCLVSPKFTEGFAGVIGGTYNKGLIPARFKELAKDENKEFYFMFPATNLHDLTQDIVLDPFNMKDKITCLPVLNVGQAMYLGTCGPYVTKDDWSKSLNHGEDMLKEVERKIIEYHTPKKK